MWLDQAVWQQDTPRCPWPPEPMVKTNSLSLPGYWAGAQGPGALGFRRGEMGVEGTGWRGWGSLGCKGRKEHWVLDGAGGGAVGKKVHSKQRDKRSPFHLTHKDRAMPLLTQVPEESESPVFFHLRCFRSWCCENHVWNETQVPHSDPDVSSLVTGYSAMNVLAVRNSFLKT